MLGRMLEPALGALRFFAIYFISLLAGSLGALIVSPPRSRLGASGAIFGLMGAAVVELRARQIASCSRGIGGLILINLDHQLHAPEHLGRRAHRRSDRRHDRRRCCCIRAADYRSQALALGADRLPGARCGLLRRLDRRGAAPTGIGLAWSPGGSRQRSPPRAAGSGESLRSGRSRRDAGCAPAARGRRSAAGRGGRSSAEAFTATIRSAPSRRARRRTPPPPPARAARHSRRA